MHPQRSVITRVLGTDPEVDVDTFAVEARPGDVFMICSDGLSSMIDDRTILEIVERHRSSLERAARALVDAANKGGGEDNITVILFEIGEGASEATVRLPVVEEPEPRPEDEQTLTELERVPTVDDTMLSTRDGLEASAEPRHHRGVPRISRTAILAGSVAGVVILAALVVWSLSRSYFVGAQRDGHVAVYQGFPWSLVGNVKLYRVRYESPVLAGQLSQVERRKLFDHALRSYDSALGSVKRYESEVVP